MTAMTPKALDRSEFYRPPITAVVPARLAVMVALGLALVMGWAADIASAPESVHLREVVVEPLRCGTNLLSNPSFEEAGPAGIPAGWQWDRRNTDAVAVTDRTQAHRGRQSLFITNGTSFGAQVYGTLWRTQPVGLVAGKPYTMSAWVKSDAPGIVSLVGGGDWQFRARARATGEQWRRIAKTFTPGPPDCNFTLRINTESITPGVWLDDVKLEEGPVATADPPEPAAEVRTSLEPDEAELEVQGDGAFSLAFTAVNSRALAGTWTAALSSGETLRQPASLVAGVGRVQVKGDAAAARDTPRTLDLRLEESGQEPVVARARLRFYSATNALNRLAVLRSRLPALQADLKAVEARGQDPAYPRVTATVLENFVGYAEEDVRRGEVRRALEQVADLEAMATRLSRELHEALAGQRQFAAVPLPNPFGPRPAPALWMDYVRFNQECFADWHKMLADAIHEAAPGLPVHAKAMTWTMINDGDVKYGVDATLFGGFSDLNGNDSVNFYGDGDGEFAQGWQMNAMACDLQRSVLDAPVFNTENHLIADRDTGFVPAAHIRAALWQAAVHGQSATTIWVWERTFDPKSDFAGSIMHRPACAEAVGLVNHDLNRAALEVTAIQQAPSQALLLQSVTASVWDAGRYTDCLGKLYAALSFTGLKLGFVTERQLEAGIVPDAPVVFVPGITHCSDAAVASLRRFKGRLVFIGEGNLLTRDEFGRPRASSLPAERINFRHGATSARELHAQLTARLPAWNLRPALELRGADQQPAWGVEWRSAETRDGMVVNLCNYRQEPATVTFSQRGRLASAHDVLTGDQVGSSLTLSPLEVRLLRVAPVTKSSP